MNIIRLPITIGSGSTICMERMDQEDTSTKIEELENKFGIDIAEAVSALTKNKELPRDKQMQDSLTRIQYLQSEVWAVKLADRITNLQPPPPNWDLQKK